MGNQISWNGWSDNTSKEQVAQAFLNCVNEAPEGCRSFLTREELASFDDVFYSRCVSKGSTQYWDQSTFTSFLQAIYPSAFTPFLDIAPLLYKIACHHANFPFPSEIPSLLDHDALLRAVVLFIGREQHVLGGKETMFSTAKGTLIIKRGRDEIDRRRRIFRSLASVPSPGQEVNEEDMKRLPTMEAADELDDLLDVLVSIQPRPRAKMIPMTREELRPIAANLSSAQPSLEDLKLGRDDLYLLMKLMLVLQLNGIDRDHLEQFLKCLPELDTVTNHLLNAFTQHHQAINYATFETVIQTTMPYLFHGVPWLFLTFLKAPPPPAATSTPPFPLSTQILNLTLLSQLSLFLHYPRAHRAADRALFPGRTRFGNLRLISQPNKDYTAVHLASVIQNEPSACILLLSANTSSALSGPAIFGSYIPNAQQDSPRNSTSSEERSIFQLRPTHRVFRAESITPTSVIHGTHKHLGQPCLTFETGSASLCVDETLSSGILTHCEQDRELGAGGVAAEIRFRVVAIEVWAL